ncbi:hypothetical protein EMIT0P291_50187 [Pseudomonas sp. IT-P291]
MSGNVNINWKGPFAGKPAPTGVDGVFNVALISWKQLNI